MRVRIQGGWANYLFGAPFPLTLVTGTPEGLKIDILLDKIIGADLSVNLNDPSDITVTSTDGGAYERAACQTRDDEFAGMIASLDAANSNFVVHNPISGMSETIHAGANTKFEDFDDHGCKSNNFSCLSTSQIVEVEIPWNQTVRSLPMKLNWKNRGEQNQ